jgi:hypothetical protein
VTEVVLPISKRARAYYVFRQAAEDAAVSRLLEGHDAVDARASTGSIVESR